MISNASHLLYKAPIKDMVETKMTGPGGTSYGLGEAGYDIRIKQSVVFSRKDASWTMGVAVEPTVKECVLFRQGRFALASTIEEFQMPDDLVGVVHDKSTWARRGLSVFNTVIEPGWKGFLTLELVYHGESELIIPAGSGIAQVVFTETQCKARYDGKYQNQENEPVPARESI